MTSTDAPVAIYDAETLAVPRILEGSKKLRGTAFSPSGELLAGSEGNQLLIWDTKKWSPKTDEFDDVRLSAGHEDREIVFWGVPAAGEKAVAPRQALAASASRSKAARSQRPERVTLLSRTNYLDNPNANQQQQFWKASGEVGVEECAPGNPCFVTRWDGGLVGTATLPADAAGRYMLLIGSASAERVHATGGDQTGESYIHGYGQGLDPDSGLGKHYSARTLATTTREADTWSTLWGVFEVGEGIRKLDFEIRQSDGSSAKTGSASRFDDLGVFLFDTEQEARAFVARYEQEVGRVVVASSAQPAQPPASPAPETTAPDASPAADPGSTITSCHLEGRVVFMSKARCNQRGGR